MTSSSSLGYVTARPTQPTFGKVIAATLWSYVGPGIFAIGIVGNILILVAMAQRRMRGTSTCVYLRRMAVADLAVLLTGMIPEWLEARNIVTVKVSNAGPDLRSTSRGFESRPPHCRVQSCASCLHTIVPLSPNSIIWYRPMGGDARRLGR